MGHGAYWIFIRLGACILFCHKLLVYVQAQEIIHTRAVSWYLGEKDRQISHILCVSTRISALSRLITPTSSTISPDHALPRRLEMKPPMLLHVVAQWLKASYLDAVCRQLSCWLGGNQRARAVLGVNWQNNSMETCGFLRISCTKCVKSISNVNSRLKTAAIDEVSTFCCKF